jgi:hypothetical protein
MAGLGAMLPAAPACRWHDICRERYDEVVSVWALKPDGDPRGTIRIQIGRGTGLTLTMTSLGLPQHRSHSDTPVTSDTIYPTSLAENVIIHN